MNRYIITLTLIFVSIFAIAQTEEDSTGIKNQEIIVYNEFIPTISDAFRIQALPTIVDTTKVAPKFTYGITTFQHQVSFTPNKLLSAKLQPEPLNPLNNGLITLGFGNYWSPLVNVYLHNNRNKKYQIGLIANSYSSFGKTKNQNDSKIFNGFSDNSVKLYAKRYLKNKSTFYTDIVFNSTLNYNNSQYFNSATNTLFTEDSYTRNDVEKIMWGSVGINTGIKSNNLQKKKMNYNIGVEYYNLFSNTNNSQNTVIVNGNFNKKVKKLSNVGIDIAYKLYSANSGVVINQNNIIANPYYKYNTKKWQIKLGLNTHGVILAANNTSTTKYYFFPNIEIQHNVSNTFIPYVHYKGGVDSYNMANLAWENPYFVNFNGFYDDIYQHSVVAGVKAVINRKLQFNIKGNYKHYNEMHFYYHMYSLSTIIPLNTNNIFTLDSGEYDKINAYAEFLFRPNNKLNIQLFGNYNHFISKTNTKAWYQPLFDAGLNVNYAINNKINVGASVNVIGPRYYLESMGSLYSSLVMFTEKKLDTYVEGNLYANYKIASNFDTFIRINNIAAQSYSEWAGIPNQGFNVMLGLNYAF